MTRFARVWQVSDLKWNNMTKIQNYKETPWGKTPHHWRLSTIKEETEVVTDYVANGSFASLAENVKYKSEEDYAVLIRLVDYNNQYKGDFVFIDKDAYEFLGKSKLFGDEIIISNVGANVGTVFRCPKLKYKMSLAPNSIMVKFKGDNDFYYYWLKSKYGQFMIQSIVTGSAQPKFNKTNFRDMLIPVPPISEQIRIAETIKSIDDKIECNRRINDNLEQQAQALFKSWFVDFEPFRDKPFVESELGMIPEGWRVHKAEEVFDINIGKTPPRKESEWFTEKTGDNVWVSIADMGNCGMFISDSSEYLTHEAINRFNIQMVEEGSILLSFKLTIGRVAIADTKLTTNEAIARFILPNKNYREFLYLYLKQYQYGNLGSTSSIATAVNSKTIKGMKLIIPTDKRLSDFNEITKPLFDKIRFLQKEISCLSQIRDTLLPRLMSGELEIQDIKESL